jgi:hypothetical protein
MTTSSSARTRHLPTTVSAQQAAAREVPDDDRKGGRIDRSERDAAARNHDRTQGDGRRGRRRRRIGAALRGRRGQSRAHHQLLRQRAGPSRAHGAHRSSAHRQEPRARRVRRAACSRRRSAGQARRGRARGVPAVCRLHRARARLDGTAGDGRPMRGNDAWRNRGVALASGTWVSDDGRHRQEFSSIIPPSASICRR